MSRNFGLFAVFPLSELICLRAKLPWADQWAYRYCVREDKSVRANGCRFKSKNVLQSTDEGETVQEQFDRLKSTNLHTNLERKELKPGKTH